MNKNIGHKFYIILISIIYIIINTIFTYNEIYIFNLFPIFIGIIYLAIYRFDILLWLTIFFTPFSVNLTNIGLGFGLSLPTEPLLAGLMILFIFKLIHEKKFDEKILKHPITIAIGINLLWILITSLSSSIPLVSLKFFISRLWFVLVLYLLITQLLRNKENISRFFWIYLIPFSIVCIYTLIQHSKYGFAQEQGHWVMSPFFNDHTSYGALIAFYFPYITIAAFNKSITANRIQYFGAKLIFILFTIALIFSYTRAAWISLIGALGVFVIIYYRVKIQTLFLLLISSIIILISFQNQIEMKLKNNRQDSSDKLSEHVKSISNISTDASNLERINRWNSALRMFKEKPFLGWGPGTYSFKYAPYQLSTEKTIISTNYGNMGNAHSEYLGPLAESGVLGALTFLAIILATIITAIKNINKSTDKRIRLLIYSCLLGLITYYLHGALNNFLDTDKASVPFWGFTAIIVVIDVYFSNKEESKQLS